MNLFKIENTISDSLESSNLPEEVDQLPLTKQSQQQKKRLQLNWLSLNDLMGINIKDKNSPLKTNENSDLKTIIKMNSLV